MTTNIDLLLKQLEEKENIIELLKETLKFYADIDNYNTEQISMDKGQLANNVLNRLNTNTSNVYENLLDNLNNIKNKIDQENNIETLKYYMQNLNGI